MRRRVIPFSLLAFATVSFSTPAWAERFELESQNDDIIGQIQVTRAYEKDTLIDIAREFDIGYDQIVKANPKVNRWVPGHNTKVRLPSMYVLPDAPREGIILNLPELRIYYFPKGSSTFVYTFPVSVGRMDWRTPMGLTKVVKKDKDPAWYPPESIRAEHAREGDPLPKMIPGGTPENPLGRYALRLGKAGYLIHGTDERKSFGIGMRVTHGCLRMYPEDIEQFFSMVPVGTKVNIIDQPIKVGRRGNRVYLEAHLPFEEEDAEPTAFELQSYRNLAYSKIRAAGIDDFNPGQIREIIEQGSGIPVAIDLGGDDHSQVSYREHRKVQDELGEGSYRDWDRGARDVLDGRGQAAGYDYSEPRLPGQSASSKGSSAIGSTEDLSGSARDSHYDRGYDDVRSAPNDYGYGREVSGDREYRARSVPPSPYYTSDDSSINYDRPERRDRYDSSNLDRDDPDLRRYESDLERSYRGREDYYRRDVNGLGDTLAEETRDDLSERSDNSRKEDVKESPGAYRDSETQQSKTRRGWNLW